MISDLVYISTVVTVVTALWRFWVVYIEREVSEDSFGEVASGKQVVWETIELSSLGEITGR